MMPIDDIGLVGWVLLGAVFLSAVFGVLWFAWLGRRPSFPQGTRYDAKRTNVYVTVVFHPKFIGTPVKRNKIAGRCAHAVWAVQAAFRHLEINASVLDRVCVLFASDVWMDGNRWSRDVAAYAIWTGASVGRGIPMAVVRESFAKEVFTTGEPVIHEMIHTVLGETETGVDRIHEHFAWYQNSGDDGVQGRARQLVGRQ